MMQSVWVNLKVRTIKPMDVAFNLGPSDRGQWLLDRWSTPGEYAIV